MSPDLADAVAAEALPPDERIRFLELCAARPAAELAADAERVVAYFEVIELAGRSDPTIDVELASRVAYALSTLARSADGLDFAERRLLAGAIEYFVEAGDEAHDYRHLSGLLDDARVTRAVCRALGRPELAAGW